jgi:hypothetical protein
MRTIETNCLTGSVRERKLKRGAFFIAICSFVLLLSSKSSFGQITNPFVQCTNGCTANDIQIQRAYLVQPTSPYAVLGPSFQCQGSASVKLALDLTAKTPRVGVYVFAHVVNHANHAIVYATVGECFSTPLASVGTTKVVFNTPVTWPCGTQIDLVDVFIGWGTGNTDFCGGSSDPRCPATPSKCFSLPPGQYITVQIPSATNTSMEQCETTVGGGTSSFDLTTKNSIVSGSASGVTVNWWGTNTGGVLSNYISSPTTYVSGSKDVYAKVKNNADTTAYSVATVALTVDPRPTAAATGDLITCSHGTATLNGSGSSASGVSYLWTGPGSITNSNLINASTATGGVYTLLITNSTTGCTASATASVSVNTSAPTAQAAGDLITCSHGTATLNGSGSTASGVSYLWTGPGSITNSNLINASTATGGVYTLLITNSTTGCTASATASVSVNTSAPAAQAAGDLITCSHGTATLNGSGSTAGGVSYLWTGPGSITNSNLINASTATGGPYTLTVTYTATGCAASATASVSVNTSAPTAQAAGDLITCSHGTATLNGSGSTASGVSYLWTGPGSITNSNLINASTATGGVYTLKVAYTSTGCSATATASVSVSTAAPTFNVNLVQPTLCTQYGSVTITPTLAGSYHYSIDNGTSFTNTTGSFTNLVSGAVTGIKIRSDATGCTSDPLSCGTTNLPSITAKAPSTNETGILVQEPTVKAYPNPFNDRVKFVINSPAAGNGSLEVYNVMGQRVKTVYQGRINAGNQSYELVIPKKQQETLIYILRVDGKKVTGKLLQLNN